MNGMNGMNGTALNVVSKTYDDKTPMKGYDIDIFERKIYFGAQFIKKAKIYNSAEYHTYLGLIRDMPDFKIVVREQKESKTRMSVKGLTREFMERNIRESFGENSEQYKEFKHQLAYSKGQLNPFMYLRGWFLDNYPNWDGKQEQREEAKKQREAEKAHLMAAYNDPNVVAAAAEKAAEAAVAAQSGADTDQP